MKASDNDEAETVRSQVFYSLPNSNRFTINSQTGVISSIGSLDYETQSSYTLIVEAIDSAIDRRTGTATVNIQVNDVQDNVPLFVETAVSGNVFENANIGTVVVTLTVIYITFFQTSSLSCNFCHLFISFACYPWEENISSKRNR